MHRATVLMALMTLAALAAHADIIYPLALTPTTDFFHGGGRGQTPRGWSFLTASDGVVVTQLGASPGSTELEYLTLWDDATRTELAQVRFGNFSFQASGWSFVNLQSPIYLTKGRTYSVIGWADVLRFHDPWYLGNNEPASVFLPSSGAIRYVTVRSDNGIDKDTYPRDTIDGTQYGVTDIGYFIGTPEPSNLRLLATVAILLIARRFWTRRL